MFPSAVAEQNASTLYLSLIIHPNYLTAFIKPQITKKKIIKILETFFSAVFVILVKEEVLG